MSLYILEFNDIGLRLSDASGFILSSPGYAHVKAKEIEFGENARKQSKVNPLNSFNQFWHKLSLDPFSKPVGHFRHNADIAFSHLQEIASSAQIKGDVVLAVPGSFSREQMAILLGLLKQSPLRPVGLVDAALLASINSGAVESVIHVDLQLHQVVLSKMQREANELKRESVILVPGTGWVNVSENLMQLFTSAFIQQCRFNPQQNASSEQMLLDYFPQWLIEESLEGSDDNASAQESRRSLQIKLKHNDTVHQASLPRSALHSRLLPFFQKVAQQIAVIDPEGTSTLLVSDRMQRLPGFEAVLAAIGQGGERSIMLLAEDSLAQAGFDHHSVLLGAPEALHFISKMTDKQAEVPAIKISQSISAEFPTHLLFEHQARRLTDGLLICMTNEVNDFQDGLRLIRKDLQEHTTDMEILGEVIREDGLFLLQSTSIKINGKVGVGPQQLALGDMLSGAGINKPIELIRVQDNDD